MRRVSGVLAVVATIALLISGRWWLSESDLLNLTQFFSLLAMAQMWNLLAGYAGMVSIGQQAFVGFGAYALFVFGDKAGIPPFAAIALAGLAAALISIPMAAVAFRLRGGYFAIGTWVLAEVVHLLAVNLSWLGAGNGTLIYSAAGLDRSLREHGAYFWAVGIGTGSVLLVYWLLRSRLGLALAAVRDDEVAARGAGVSVRRVKLLVWVLAAFGCALAGAVYNLPLLRVQPDAAFSVNWSAYVIFIVVIGGLGTIEGPIIGTIIFFTLQQKLAGYGVWYLIILGALALVVAVWTRRGLWGSLADRYSLRIFAVQRRL